MAEEFTLPLQIGGEAFNKHVWPGGISIISGDGVTFLHGLDILGKYGNIASLDFFPSSTDDPSDAGMAIRFFEEEVGDTDETKHMVNASGLVVYADRGLTVKLSQKKSDTEPIVYSNVSGLTISYSSEDPLENGLAILVSKRSGNVFQITSDGVYVAAASQSTGVLLRYNDSGKNISGMDFFERNGQQELGIRLSDVWGALDTSGLQIDPDKGLSIKLFTITALVNMSGLTVVPGVGLMISLYMNPLDLSINSSGLEIVPIVGIGGLRIKIADKKYNALSIGKEAGVSSGLYAQIALLLMDASGENISGLAKKDFTDTDGGAYEGIFINLVTGRQYPNNTVATDVSGLRIYPQGSNQTLGTGGISIVLSREEGNIMRLRDDGLYCNGGVVLLVNDEDENISGLQLSTPTEDHPAMLSIHLNEPSGLKIMPEEGLSIKLKQSTSALEITEGDEGGLSVHLADDGGLKSDADQGLAIKISDDQNNVLEIKTGEHPGLYVPESFLTLLENAEGENIAGLKFVEDTDGDKDLTVWLKDGTSGLQIEPNIGLSIKISEADSNAVEIKDDGLYVKAGSVLLLENVSWENISGLKFVDEERDGETLHMLTINPRVDAQNKNVSALLITPDAGIEVSLKKNATNENVSGIYIEPDSGLFIKLEADEQGNNTSGLEIVPDKGLSIQISNEANNIVEIKNDGLFVKQYELLLLDNEQHQNISGLKFVDVTREQETLHMLTFKTREDAQSADISGLKIVEDEGVEIRLKKGTDGTDTSGLEIVAAEGLGIKLEKDASGRDVSGLEITADEGLSIKLKEEKSGLQIEPDTGLEVQISAETNNKLRMEDDGLFVEGSSVEAGDGLKQEDEDNVRTISIKEWDASVQTGPDGLKVRISALDNNGLSLKDDGLYVAGGGDGREVRAGDGLQQEDDEETRVRTISIKPFDATIVATEDGVMAAVSGNEHQAIRIEDDGLYVDSDVVKAGDGLKQDDVDETGFLISRTISVKVFDASLDASEDGLNVKISSERNNTLLLKNDGLFSEGGMQVIAGDGLGQRDNNNQRTIFGKAADQSINVSSAGIKVKLSGRSYQVLETRSDGLFGPETRISSMGENHLQMQGGGLYLETREVENDTGEGRIVRGQPEADIRKGAVTPIERLLDLMLAAGENKIELRGDGLFLEQPDIASSGKNAIQNQNGLWAPATVPPDSNCTKSLEETEQRFLAPNKNNPIYPRFENDRPLKNRTDAHYKLHNVLKRIMETNMAKTTNTSEEVLLRYKEEEKRIAKIKKEGGHQFCAEKHRRKMEAREAIEALREIETEERAGLEGFDGSNRIELVSDGLFANDGKLASTPNNGISQQYDGLQGDSTKKKCKKEDEDDCSKPENKEKPECKEDDCEGDQCDPNGDGCPPDCGPECPPICPPGCPPICSPGCPPVCWPGCPPICPVGCPPFCGPDPKPNTCDNPTDCEKKLYSWANSLTDSMNNKWNAMVNSFNNTTNGLNTWGNTVIPAINKWNKEFSEAIYAWAEELTAGLEVTTMLVKFLMTMYKKEIHPLIFGSKFLAGKQFEKTRIWWFDWNDQFLQCPQTREDLSSRYSDGWDGGKTYKPNTFAYQVFYCKTVYVGFTGTARQSPAFYHSQYMCDVKLMKLDDKGFPDGTDNPPHSGIYIGTYVKFSVEKSGDGGTVAPPYWYSDGGYAYRSADLIHTIEKFRVYSWGIGYRYSTHGTMVFDGEDYMFSAIKALKLPPALMKTIYHEDSTYVYFKVKFGMEICTGLSDIYDDSLDVNNIPIVTHYDLGSRCGGGYDPDNMIDYGEGDLGPDGKSFGEELEYTVIIDGGRQEYEIIHKLGDFVYVFIKSVLHSTTVFCNIEQKTDSLKLFFDTNTDKTDKFVVRCVKPIVETKVKTFTHSVVLKGGQRYYPIVSSQEPISVYVMEMDTSDIVTVNMERRGSHIILDFGAVTPNDKKYMTRILFLINVVN